MIPLPTQAFFDPAEDKVFEFVTTHARTHPHMTVRWGGREVLPGALTFIEHRNPPWAYIKFAVRGKGIFRYGDNKARIEPGMVFWSKPEAWSRLEAVEGATLVNYVIVLVGQDLKSLFGKFLHAQAGFTRLVRPQDVESIMREIMVEGLGAGDHREVNCTHLAEVLLRRIDANMSSTMKPKKLARKTYWECKKYMETNFEHITELGHVATACGVTVPYICRLFDQFDKVRAYVYLSALKMGRAERLLTNTQMAIKDIAAAVGYKDLQLFSRNFTLHHGMNATQYRKVYG